MRNSRPRAGTSGSFVDPRINARVKYARQVRQVRRLRRAEFRGRAKTRDPDGISIDSLTATSRRLGFING